MALIRSGSSAGCRGNKSIVVFVGLKAPSWLIRRTDAVPASIRLSSCCRPRLMETERTLDVMSIQSEYPSRRAFPRIDFVGVTKEPAAAGDLDDERRKDRPLGFYRPRLERPREWMAGI